MAKIKQTKEQELAEISGWKQNEKALKVLKEYQSKKPKVKKVWIDSKKYFPSYPRISVEVPKGLTNKQIKERISHLIGR